MKQEQCLKQMLELGHLRDAGLYLENLPEEHQKYELYELAVDYGVKLRFVPKKHRSQEICKRALEIISCDVYHTLECIPEEVMTYEMSELAVTTDGEALLWIPMEHRDYEMCKLAIDNIKQYC